MIPVKREIEHLYVDLIEVHDRARPVSEEAVKTLAASISSLGLRTPISVRYYPERPDHIPPGDTHDALVLMTGAHRLEAAKQLGWEKIECFVYHEGDEIDAQLWEIAENLHRADLTKEQRDEHIRRYAELLESRGEVLGQNVPKPQGGRPESVATKVAEGTGLSAKTIRRALNPERARVEREKNADRQALRTEAEEKLAALLAECVPGHFWDALKANLYAAGCKKVAQEFERLIGVSVFDASRSGERIGAERNQSAAVAQQAEQPICDRPVAGSTPAGGSIYTEDNHPPPMFYPDRLGEVVETEPQVAPQPAQPLPEHAPVQSDPDGGSGGENPVDISEPRGVPTTDPPRSGAATREDAGSAAPKPSSPETATKHRENVPSQHEVRPGSTSPGIEQQCDTLGVTVGGDESGTAAPAYPVPDDFQSDLPPDQLQARIQRTLKMRPECQQPWPCGSSGPDACWACKKAGEAA